MSLNNLHKEKMKEEFIAEVEILSRGDTSNFFVIDSNNTRYRVQQVGGYKVGQKGFLYLATGLLRQHYIFKKTKDI